MRSKRDSYFTSLRRTAVLATLLLHLQARLGDSPPRSVFWTHSLRCVRHWWGAPAVPSRSPVARFSDEYLELELYTGENTGDPPQ